MCFRFFVAGAAVLVASTRDNNNDNENYGRNGSKLRWEEIFPITLIAFQSSGQAVTSRVLKFPGLTSVVLTDVYCDSFASPDCFTLSVYSDVEERRQVAAIICVLIGTLMGVLGRGVGLGLLGRCG